MTLPICHCLAKAPVTKIEPLTGVQHHQSESLLYQLLRGIELLLSNGLACTPLVKGHDAENLDRWDGGWTGANPSNARGPNAKQARGLLNPLHATHRSPRSK